MCYVSLLYLKKYGESLGEKAAKINTFGNNNHLPQ